ncbi:MAG TPA: PAS domain S-box protein, partial [Capsulimonadaceae bacterium]|nr:PAS domain S-box protein [Capsulimonadaceae bacterium]
MWTRVPLSAILYLFLGVAALALPFYLVGWLHRGIDDSHKVTLALLCTAIFCLALSLIQSFRLVCQLRRAQERIARQNADLERQGGELEATNEELRAQQVELEHTANNLIGTNILLLQSSRRFQELFQGVPIACYCYDQQGRIIEWNRACEALYGFPSDEIFEKKIWETICGSEESERAKEVVERVFAGESFEGIEWTNLRVDGSECRVLCNTFPLRAHDGAILGAICANIDITERAAALDALAENEERYRRLVEHTPDGIAVISSGKVVYFNPAGMALFGASKPEEMLGKPILDLIHPAHVGSAKKWMRESGRDASAEIVQQRVIRLDGRVIDVEATAIPINYKGHPALQVVIRDITARLQAESLLHQQSAAMEASIDGCALLNQQGEYIFLNQAHAAVYGYENIDDLLGKSWRMLYDEEELARFETHIMPAVIRDGIWRGEAVGRKRDGSIFHQEVSLTLIEGGGLACVVRDITERKEAEEKLHYIMSGAQCLLWVGTVVEEEDGELSWTLNMPDEEAAQRFLPLNLTAGQSYGDGWYDCRPEDDRERTNLWGAENTRLGKSYSQEFRCRRADGEIRWMAEDVGVEPLGPGKWRAVGVCTDITERKRVEDKLQYLMTGARCLLWDSVVADMGNGLLDWDIKVPDEAAAQRFLPLEMLAGETYSGAWYRCRLEEDRERCDRFGVENIKIGKSYSQEFRCRRADGEIRWLAEDVAVEELGPGKWRVVGVCMDITERKHAEKVTRSVTEAALCLLWEAEIVDEGGDRTVWYMSMTDEGAAQRFLPLDIDPGQSYVDAWYLARLEEDRIAADLRSEAALRENESYSQEFRCRRADGEIRWLAEDVAIEPLGPGKWRAVGVCLDVTERKRAEELSRSVTNTARCLLWEAVIQDPGGDEKLVWDFRISEEAALRFLPLEMQPGDTFNSAWYRSRVDEDKERCDRFGDENIKIGKSYSQEFRCRMADGEIRWLAEDVNVEPLGPSKWRAVGVCLDITERKRAEEISRSIVDAARCLLWEALVEYVDGRMKWDMRLTDEEAALRFLPLEIEPGDNYHKAWYKSRLEEDKPRTNAYGREKVLANQSYSQEFRCRRADGEIRWLVEDVAVEPLGRNKWRAAGICMDITERKRAEEVSRSIVEAGRCLLWEASVEREGEKTRWDIHFTDEDAAQRFMPLDRKGGRSYQEAWHQSRLDEDRQRINKYATEKILAGSSYSQEFRVRREDGEIRWLSEDVAVEPIGPDKWRAMGICMDITERKRAEEMARSIVSAGRCLLWEAEVRLEHGRLRWDFHLTDEEAARRFLPINIAPNQTYHDAWYFARLEEDQTRMARYCREKILANQSYSQEFRCRREDGEIRWLAEDVAIEPLGPERWRAVGVCLDITERKRAEEMSRSIVDAARCLLWEAEITDYEGVLGWRIQIFDEEAAQRFLPLNVEECDS